MRILVIDHDRGLGRSLEILLRESGHDVRRAGLSPGDPGVDRRFVPDLVVLDAKSTDALRSVRTGISRECAAACRGAIVLASMGESFDDLFDCGIRQFIFLAKPPDWEQLRRFVDAMGLERGAGSGG
jgi:DNA-binding response OmpR family regulator